ncbi:MAG TPA: DUF1467 family protein, partial [Rhizobiales bacterium]|nr:DUF1467 family protein [Hyphomicrobiales bacterium]
QEVEKGHVSSAPVNPRIARKFAITTLLACVIFAVVYWVLTSGVISLDDFTFLPEFRPIQ